MTAVTIPGAQTVTLNQTKPEPIVATAWSKAEGVGGGRDHDYSLYLDLVYTDGTPLWGQVDSFNVGTHDWKKIELTAAAPANAAQAKVSLHHHFELLGWPEPQIIVRFWIVSVVCALLALSTLKLR